MKKDILELPFHEIAGGTSIEAFVEEHEPQNWWMPQIVAFFGNMKPVKNDEGLLCIKATLFNAYSSFAESGTVEDPKSWYKGILDVVKSGERSKMLPGKSYESARYSQLVPLVLSGFKQNQDIPYMSWARDTLHFAIEDHLLEAMLFDRKIDLPEGEGYFELVRKLCTKRGKVFPADTCAALGHYKDTVLEDVPKFVRTMATQTWLAHPTHRDTTYMVLDWLDWDATPEPKVSADVLVPKKERTKKAKPDFMRDSDVPWM